MTASRPFLRQYGDPQTLEPQRREAETALAEAEETGDIWERLRWMGRLGEVYRILDDPQRAIPLLENALALAAEMNAPEYWVANALRLGTAIQHQERHEAADALFRAGLATSRGLPDHPLEDFLLQHRGKCLAEMGRLDEAIAHFQEALSLREAKGDASLLASTREALALAQAWADPAAQERHGAGAATSAHLRPAESARTFEEHDRLR